MRTSRRTVLLTLLVLAATACGSEGNDAEPPAPATSEAPPSTAPETTLAAASGVTLEEAGAQPRQPLTLKIATGSVARAAMVNKLGIELTVDGRALPMGVAPATKVVIEQRADRVDADGTTHFSVTFADVSVVATPGADPALARQVEAGMAQLEGLRGTGVVDAHNEVRSFSIDSGRVTDPTVASTLGSVSSQIGNLSAPFPKEPVGVGARWTVRRSATITGFTMEMTTRYTLRSRAGDRYELDITQEAVSRRGPASFPNLPPEIRATVADFTLQSKGRLSGNLTRTIPLTSSMTGTGDGTLTVTVGGEDGTMRQRMTIDTSVSAA